MKIEIVANNATQTEEIAKKIAKSLPPCVISLCGELGAGKTTFAKGFAKGLGIDKIVTSPTFTLLNEYENGDKNLFHFDLYRLSSLDEAMELGFIKYFNDPKAYTLVEWAENCKGILPNSYFEIKIEKISDSQRKITMMEKK